MNNQYRPVGEAPFGLIGADETNDIEGWWQKASDRVADQAEELARDARGAGRDFFNRFRRFFRDVF